MSNGTGFGNLILRFFRGFINRKTLIIIFIATLLAGIFLLVIGTFPPDENFPIRVEFSTYSKYTNEINSFFNRTDVTPYEDAHNKLIEDYRVNGLLILPKSPKPAEGYPVIVWMHGFAAAAELQINYPRQFAKSGFLSIAISLPGHGFSGGYWDIGIQALLGIYSTVEWLVNDSAFKGLIDKTRIGVAGHSMGGITTTRSGIFDNWTNPETGRKVGTGGAIRSFGAMYCWDNLESMAKGLMGQVLGIEALWSNPSLLNLLRFWRFLTNYDPSIIQEELRLRSVSNFINSTNIPNYCLITGSEDELTTTQAQCHIMANSTIDGSGNPVIPWNQVYTNVTQNANNTWDYGNMTQGNARRFVLVPGVTHIIEAFSYTALQNYVLWFNDSMNCTNINTNVPPTANIPFTIKMIGWLLTLIGAVGCILPLFSYLSTSKIKTESPLPTTASKVENKWRLYLLYAGISIAAIGLSSLVWLPSITHFWVFDILIPMFLMGAVFLLPCVVILSIVEMKKNDYKIEDIGLGKSILDNLKAVAIPLIAIILCITVFDLLGWFFQVPFLLPRPFDPLVYIDFLTLLGILLLQVFGFELLFRGLFQTKLENYGGRKLTKWKVVLISGLFSGVCIGIGHGINLVVGIGGLLVGAPYLIPALFVGMILLNFLLGIASAYIYQRTRNILSATFFIALMQALFMGGKLFLTYA